MTATVEALEQRARRLGLVLLHSRGDYRLRRRENITASNKGWEQLQTLADVAKCLDEFEAAAA